MPIPIAETFGAPPRAAMPSTPKTAAMGDAMFEHDSRREMLDVKEDIYQTLHAHRYETALLGSKMQVFIEHASTEIANLTDALSCLRKSGSEQFLRQKWDGLPHIADDHQNQHANATGSAVSSAREGLPEVADQVQNQPANSNRATGLQQPSSSFRILQSMPQRGAGLPLDKISAELAFIPHRVAQLEKLVEVFSDRLDQIETCERCPAIRDASPASWGIHCGSEVRSRFEKLELVCTEHAKKIEEVFSKLDEVAMARTETNRASFVKVERSFQSEASESAAVLEVVEKIARKGMSDPLSGSFWEIAMVCGLGGQTWIETMVTVFLLILVVLINVIFCLFLLTELSHDDTDVDAARAWRLDVGHWYATAAVDGQSMVDQMCESDLSLPSSAAQRQQFENARKYHTKFLNGAPMGMFLCAWCVLVFFFLIWDEVQKSMVRVLTVLHLERAARSRIVPLDDEFVLSKISVFRLVGNLLLCGVRVGVAFIFLYSGSTWLVFTEDAESLILNAVALVFVLDIDELVYQIACPSSIKALLETMKPLDKPSVGPLHAPLRALGTICGSICVLLLFGTLRLRPFASEMLDLREAFCGGNTNFVAGTNPATGIVYEYTRHQAPQGNRSNLMRSVVLELRDNSYKSNHITSKTLQEFTADVASTLADNVGRFGLQCADVQPDAPGSAPSAGALLAAMKDSIGNSAQALTNCSQLNFGQCTMDPAIIRLACPVTCGCSLAFEGNFRTSGCPITFCSALRSFTRGLYSQPNHDIDMEVLPLILKWNVYWQSVLSYTPTYGDTATWAKWNLRGLSKPVLVHIFKRFGCNAFKYFRTRYLSEYRSISNYFCHEQNKDTRRPVAIFCPHACDCTTRVKLGVSTFCPRTPPVNVSIYVPSRCPRLRVRNATMLDNSQCKQDFSNRTGFSHPEGWYSCSPNAYNGKHVYSYIVSSRLRWEIRWESATQYDWGAYILGHRVGLGRTSKWALSSIDTQVVDWTGNNRSRVGRFFNSYSTALPSHHGWFPRTSSNTDFDCASGDMTAEGAAKYFLQRDDRNDCPSGYGLILHEYACVVAAAAIQVKYKGIDYNMDYPKGCYVWMQNSGVLQVWHNLHHKGSATPGAQPLCEQTVGVNQTR